jgi:hypothetical protein
VSEIFEPLEDAMKSKLLPAMLDKQLTPNEIWLHFL